MSYEMNTKTKPSNSYTLERFIELGKASSITYRNFSYREIASNGTEISVLNVVNDYMDELKSEAVNVKLTDDQYRKYKYKPKLLCIDVYGTTEVYFLILLLNGMADIKEFDLHNVKMLRKDDLNTALTAIYNAEHSYIDQYNANHNTFV